MIQKHPSTIVCKRCGKESPRRGQVQKYCKECSIIASKETKKKWVSKTPQTIEQKAEQLKKYRFVKNELKELAKKNREKPRNITWISATEIAPLWAVRVCVPFDYGFSKNSIWCINSERGSHVLNREHSRNLKKMLGDEIKNALRHAKITPANAKVWIDILVQKPNHKGDAVNVIDSVCDAIKEAIGVDDRWFSIFRLDWEIVKDNPKLYVGIRQETDINQRACSYCGEIKPIVSFPKRKHVVGGHARVCSPCGRLSTFLNSKTLRERRLKKKP